MIATVSHNSIHINLNMCRDQEIKSTAFTPDLKSCLSEEIGSHRTMWSSTKLMKLIANCTNAMLLANSGSSLSTLVN